MPKQIQICAIYDGDADRIFNEALNFEEVEKAMSGFAVYEGTPKGNVEEGATFSVDVTFWGIFKNKGHVIHVEKIDRANRVIQSREHNKTISRWDHNLSIQPFERGVRWTDTIILEAGWQTAFAARFALFVYKRRHRYRQALHIETSVTDYRD